MDYPERTVFYLTIFGTFTAIGIEVLYSTQGNQKTLLGKEWSTMYQNIIAKCFGLLFPSHNCKKKTTIFHFFLYKFTLSIFVLNLKF